MNETSQLVSADGWLAFGAALLLGVPTLIWTIRGAIRRSQPFQLEYFYWHASRLLTLPERTTIQVRVNGELVTSAWQLTVRFVNSGKEPIRAEEWSAPVRLTFPDGARPITSVLSAVKPSALRVEAKVSGQTVEIEPVLLNQGDLFELQIVGDGDYAPPVAQSRIANLPSMLPRKYIYPPGNGPEGRLELGNHIINVVFLLAGPGLALLAFRMTEATVATKFIFAATAIILFDVLYPLFIRSADKRREVWRPSAYVAEPPVPNEPVAGNETEDEDLRVQTAYQKGLAEGKSAPPDGLPPLSPRWTLIPMDVENEEHGPRYRRWKLVNMADDSAAYNVRVECSPKARFTFTDGGTWKNMSGRSERTFGGQINEKGAIEGYNLTVWWNEGEPDPNFHPREEFNIGPTESVWDQRSGDGF